MKKSMVISFLFFSITVSAQADKGDDLIRSGNDYFKEGQYSKAAEEYRKALDKEPSSLTAKFNLGNAYFKQNQQVDAAKLFTNVIQGSDKKDMLSKTWYNKGVVLSAEKNLEESIEAYKNALRNDPNDKEARENLQKALLELKKKQPPPKQNEQQKKKKEQQQKQQQQSKMSPKEAEQRLKLLQQKEKEVQQRMQQEKSKMGGSQPKDW